jgi:protein-tyrosine phosphatase
VNPARTLPFTAMFNFRDVGGYAGLDGRSVRWRRLFRSDSLHRLADAGDSADRAAFAALGIRSVVDLRRPYEVERDGRVPAYDGLGYHHIHPEHAEWRESGAPDLDTLPRWLADRYLDLATDGGAGIAAALAVLADARHAPAVVHCVAGKDRTGVVCALTLSLLGVADDDIAADYALSTAAAERLVDWYRRTEPDAVPASYLTSPPEAMRLFLDDLRARYGTVERYVLGAGLPAERIAALRAHLLTDGG